MGVKLKYSFEKIQFNQLAEKVILPKFQRSLVWSDDNKKTFIQTVLAGEPFGSLLLYKELGSEKFLIIDGLQRYTTLMDFKNDPYKYVDIKIEEYKELIDVVDYIYNKYNDTLRETISDHVLTSFKLAVKKFYQSNNKYSSYISEQFIKELSKRYEIEDLKSTIQLRIFDFWEKYSKDIDITNLEIPVILYNGDMSELPNIFEKLNTGGTKLTKYEVFASSWNNVELRLLNNQVHKKILQNIEKRYEDLIEETDISIEDYNEGDIISTGRVTLYEYVYGLSKEILNNNRNLLGKKRVSYAKDDSIGFSTLATFLNLHLRDVGTLNRIINSNIEPANISNLSSIIMKMYEDVSKMLLPYINFNYKFIEAQIISIVHTWFRLNFEIDTSKIKIIPTSKYKHLHDDFKKFMPMRFLYDILNNTWSGAGDSTLFNMIRQNVEESSYLRPVSISSWETKLNELVEDQLLKPMRTISNETKLLLSYIAKNNLKGDKYYKFDLVVPKKFVPNTKPISHLGNVFIHELPKVDKNKMIEEQNIEIKDIYFKPTIINYTNYRILDEELYEKMIKSRSNQIIEYFKNMYL